MTNDLKNASALQIVLRTYEFLSLASYIKNLMTPPNVAKISFYMRGYYHIFCLDAIEWTRRKMN